MPELSAKLGQMLSQAILTFFLDRSTGLLADHGAKGMVQVYKVNEGFHKFAALWEWKGR